MTTKEFSDEFDTLLDSYKMSPNFGDNETLAALKLDEYEKSVYLTKAQEELVVALYSGKGGNSSYEEDEELRRYLANLNRTKDFLAPFDTPDDTGVADNSVFVTKPFEALFITIERAQISSSNKCDDGKWIDVVPMRRDEFNIARNNPFRNIRIWRIDHPHQVELVPQKYTITKYRMGYLKRPRPIVLDDLIDTDVNGVKVVTECELNPILHRDILVKAVQTAMAFMAAPAQQTQK